MKLRYIILFLIQLHLFTNCFSQGQDLIAMPDSLCINSGENFSFNVTTNDIIPQNTSLLTVISEPQSPCFRINDKGDVLPIPNATNCCGTHIIHYTVRKGNQTAFATLTIVVKCPKPNCTLVDLEEEVSDPAGGGTTPPTQGKKVFYACEDNPVTYFVTYNPTYTYTWTVGAGGTTSPGVNAAEIIVNWSNPGANTITLQINNGVTTTTQVFCIEVLPAPIAAFTTAMACVCNNSPISFTNTSSGASSYYWDFGDGNNSTQTNPTHTYNGGGTYTVTLYAYSDNFDPQGNPLCCCVDTAQMIITVEDLPGPDILWVSTLCEGDTSKYWTTATGCGMVWSVFDANNNPIPFTGQGNDTICVVWGSGPHGYVTLDLNACSPAVYCEKPVTVLVPIISSVGIVEGENNVCAGSKEKYKLPKWNGTTYNWTVTGGMIVSGQGSHEVLIMWGAGPTGTINVNYFNSFLQGLPGHDNEDCEGIANFNVVIRPEYSINQAPPQICKGDNIFLATSLPGAPLAFTWTISPSQTGWPIVGVSSINPTLNNVGFYKICVYPNDPNLFCNDTICTYVNVKDLAAPDSISGDKIICPGSTEFYTAYHSNPSVKFDWVVTGGTPSTFSGNPISITWNATGPYSISVKATDLASPFCMSTPISCPITKRQLVGPLAISSGNGCTNSIAPYSITGPIQDPLTTYTWSIINNPPDGSIYLGQGTRNVDIQWNNTPGPVTIKCVVRLCNDSIVLLRNVNLIAPAIPIISQNMPLCPGVTVTLSPGAGFTSATWNMGVPSPPTNVLASTAGLYVVTTTDGNGCTAKASYTLDSQPGPYTTISTGNFEGICVVPALTSNVTVTYNVVNIPNTTYEWFCNGVSQGPASIANLTFIHTATPTSTVGVFNYQVRLVDTNTNCVGWTNIRTVIHQDCSGSGTGTPCPGPGPTVVITASNPIPTCNQFTFGYTTTGPISGQSWNFNDPFGVVNNPGPINPIFTYSSAGNYLVSLTYTFVVNGVTCQKTVYKSIQVPVAPNFKHEFTANCREIKFTDLTGLLGATISQLEWDWDDATANSIVTLPGTGSMITHTYANPGPYNVTLTVTTTSGCIISITKPILVGGVSTATFTASPMPACVGDDVAFTYLGNQNDILTFLYNFGDGSNNGGPAPFHAYLTPANPYLITLTVTDIYGCTATSTKNLVINPRPANDTITYAPSLKVCSGKSVTLTAPLQTGGSYSWNTGQTTQAIVVNTAGIYKVTVTNSFGCPRALDSVEVTICPLPLAEISGSHFICDNDCITLQATLGFDFQYDWYDKFGILLPLDTTSTLQVCWPSTPFQDSVYVVVTDANGCSTTSAWWTIQNVVSPSVVINVVSGDLCAQTPNMLTAVATPSTNVVYTWSDGTVGPTIIAIQAVTYTVYAKDTITGCTDNASVIVNPLPDFCELPSGCYEACNPDTLCGPAGMLSYQWNFNGSPITGANMQCLEVDMSGSYSLTAVNTFGCDATSDTLILQLIHCCDSLDTEVTYNALTPGDDDCCYKLNYTNTQDSLIGLYIYTSDADLTFSNINPALSLVGNTSSSITLQDATAGDPLPMGTLSNFINICATNITNTPVVVYFSWLGPDAEHLCLDSIILECQPSECVYIDWDTVKCNPDLPGQYVYTVTVCNPVSNTFTIRYLDLVELAPAGLIISVSPLSIPPLTPGNCATFNFNVSGPSLVNNTMCFNLIAHEYNPAVNPNAKCCPIDTARCIFLPPCGPCDSAYVVSIMPGEDSCCFKLTIDNNHTSSHNLKLAICGITTGTTLSVNNFIGSGWTTVPISASAFGLNHSSGSIPPGVHILPDFCVESGGVAYNDIEIKWISSNAAGVETICRDTIEVICESDCGYFELVDVTCKESNVYSAEIIFHNTSSYTVYSAAISFVPSTPGNNTIINFPGGVPPNGTSGPHFVTLGPSFAPLSTVCMIATLHNNPPTLPSTICCQFKTNIPLPDCDNGIECKCDEEFEKQANLGVTCTIVGNTVTFTPIGTLTECDRVLYDFFYNQTTQVGIGNQPVQHTFPAKGGYEVCITIIRTQPNGKECKVKIIKLVKIKQIFNFKVSPNPASNEVFVDIETNDDEKVMQKLTILNNEGRPIKTHVDFTDKTGKIMIPIAELRPGIYIIRVEGEEEMMYKKFIKIE